jgi:hypothetical protein
MIRKLSLFILTLSLFSGCATTPNAQCLAERQAKEEAVKSKPSCDSGDRSDGTCVIELDSHVTPSVTPEEPDSSLHLRKY